MKLEQQVVSLELAKKLKELGVKQESYFAWRISSNNSILVPLPDHRLYKHFEYASAFTVAELGEILPKSINWGQGVKDFEQIYHEDRNVWIVRYYVAGSGISPRMEEANTEADARAKMLIYLIENKLITPNSTEL